MNPPVVLSVRIKGDQHGPQTGDVVLNAASVADFSEEDTYLKGEVVVYNGDMVRADEDIEIPGPFDDTKWTAISSGTANYNLLENKPSIENVELEGNKTLDEFGGAYQTDLDAAKDEIENLKAQIETLRNQVAILRRICPNTVPDTIGTYHLTARVDGTGAKTYSWS